MFRFLDEHPEAWERLLIALKRACEKRDIVARVDFERLLDRALVKEPVLQPYRAEIVYLFATEGEMDLDDDDRVIAMTVRQAVTDLFGDELVKRKEH